MDPAIFLDRDGVLVENRPSYILRWEDVQLFPGALTALAWANRSPWKFVLVTNQSAIGRGLISLEIAREINRRLVSMIEQAGGRIDGVFMCPHAPQDQCACRKPKPGLILEAAQTLSLDLSRSVMIGDALSDIQAGQAAHVNQTVLVKTGLGTAQAKLPHPKSIRPYLIFDDLYDALLELIKLP
jgi:D-glycero-D-manno-heptose 1,7-bisphosphate phosphatase